MLLGGYLDGRLGPLPLILSGKNLTHLAATWVDYWSNMIDRPLWIFFKHFGYFECKYESIVSSGCLVLLGGYLRVD